jgi:hypothetical protein
VSQKSIELFTTYYEKEKCRSGGRAIWHNNIHVAAALNCFKFTLSTIMELS